MSNRSWFYASQGQQQGPYPEAQFREFVARGMVGADMLVWTEGMAAWQRAGDIPGLMSAASGPPAVPYSSAAASGRGALGIGSLSIDLGVWSLLGRSLLFVIGTVLVIPAPWVGTSFYRWIISRLHVPGRPNLAFNGQVGDLWYVFVLMGLMSGAGLVSNYLQLVAIPVQAFLSWMLLRWLASNLSSNGHPLGITFSGSALTFIGWQILLCLSFITIIGWAWVTAAWMRWNCRNISGTRREVAFQASGLGILWRTIVFAIGCAFLIPIPWVLRWYTTWYVSQFELVERGAFSNA